MKIVYATATTMVQMGQGRSEMVTLGSHWPASDPMVTMHPGLFSEDPRHGLAYSTPPPEEEMIVQEAPIARIKRAYHRRQVRV